MKLSIDDKITILNPIPELPSVVRQITAPRLLDIIAQAENGDTRDLFALYRDVISSDNQIQGEFGKRKGALLADTVNLLPWDRHNPASIAAKDLCWPLIDSQAFLTLQQSLLDATLYPVAVAEKIFKSVNGSYILASINPVPYQLLDYRSGNLRIFDTADGQVLQTSHAPDPARYIIHRGHVLSLPDQWGGPMRSILFWWLLRTMSRQWWADLLERYGVPFLKGKYSDEAGRQVLERAFHMAVRLGAIVISKGTEAEIVQAASSDKSDSHERFIELCNREISKLITGQTLSTQTAPTGELGGGTANLHAQVRDDLRQMDARLLSVTIRDQLFAQLCRINGHIAAPPMVVFGSQSSAEVKALITLIESLSGAGFEPDDDGLANLAERVGFGIRRKTSPGFSPAIPFGLNATITDQIAPDRASTLADAFTDHFTPVADIIRKSETPEDCIDSVRAWALSAGISNISDILEQALTAYAAAGASSATPKT